MSGDPTDSGRDFSNEEQPWLRFYEGVPRSLSYPEGSLTHAVLSTAASTPRGRALIFLGTVLRYRELAEQIEQAAAALYGLGLRSGDRLMIALPTSPQGVIAFYATIRLGAIAVMVHPLCTAPEIEYYVKSSRSRMAVTLDFCYPKFAGVKAAGDLDHLIITRISDPLGPIKRLGYRLTRGRTVPTIPRDPKILWWRQLSARSWPAPPRPMGRSSDPAAVLFSGGTTGSPKGIVLTNRNLIAEGMQAATWVNLGPRDVMLAALPIFHGAGLGLCINAVLLSGGTVVLVPTFSPESVAAAIRRNRSTLIVGVPTLYDSLTRDRSLARADLSSLRAAFSGADTMPRPVRDRFEQMVARAGGNVRLFEGYGLTEAVTGIMAMPLGVEREGSIGIPFPDMLAMICRPGTEEAVPDGVEGEICLSGPSVMPGYLDDPAATAEALRRHGDGRTWLHTGDLGRRDTDGFFYFSTRLKRMIKSSGFNVYPAQVEEVLYQHPAVAEACVIGLPDSRQGERVVACVVLKTGTTATPAIEGELIEFCRERLIKWSCPRTVRFIVELPKTRLGKVDYRAVAEELKITAGPEVQGGE